MAFEGARMSLMKKTFGRVHDGDNLIPLEQWNSERREFWNELRASVMHPELFSNGLECPVCKCSLYDTHVVVGNSPTVMIVKCMNLSCNWRGERYD